MLNPCSSATLVTEIKRNFSPSFEIGEQFSNWVQFSEVVKTERAVEILRHLPVVWTTWTKYLFNMVSCHMLSWESLFIWLEHLCVWAEIHFLIVCFEMASILNQHFINTLNWFSYLYSMKIKCLHQVVKGVNTNLRMTYVLQIFPPPLKKLVKHGEYLLTRRLVGSIMLLACFSSDVMMFLNNIWLASATILKMGLYGVFYQDNDPKHMPKSERVHQTRSILSGWFGV